MSEILRRIRPHARTVSVVIACLALSLAITSVTQSVAFLLLSGPLPIPNADRLAEIRVLISGKAGAFPGNNSATVAAWTQSLGREAVIASERRSTAKFRFDGVDHLLRASYVDGNYFQVFPLFGPSTADLQRDFAAEENLVVVRRGFYQRVLHSTQGIRYLRIADVDYRVVLVTDDEVASPASLSGHPEDVWLPLKHSQTSSGNRTEYSSTLHVFAQLAAGKGPPEIENELNALFLPRIKSETANTFPPGTSLTISVAPLRETVVGDSAKAASVFLVSTSLVYVLVCSVLAQYVASILSTRWRAQFIKHVLGATRRHLVTEVLLELVSGLLVACALAIMLAAVGLHLLRRVFAEAIPRILEATLDLHFFVGLFTLAGGALLIISVAVIIRINTASIATLPTGTKGYADSPLTTGHRLVIGIQFVLVTLSLLIASFALTGVFRKLTLDVGFKTDGLLLVEIELPQRLQSTDAKRLLAERLQTGMRSDTAAGSVALVDMPPLSPGFTLSKVQQLRENSAVLASVIHVNESYLALLNMRPVAGRSFTPEEIRQQQRAVILSKSLSLALFPSASAVGEELTISGDVYHVIGVVNDIRNPFRNDEAARLQAYLPMEFYPESTDMTLLVSYESGHPPEVPDLSRRIHSIDGELFVGKLEPLNETYLRALNRGLFQTSIAAIAFAVALGIAALIVYSSVLNNYTVHRRSTLIRAAVGANSRTLLRSLLLSTLAGIAVGGVVSAVLFYAVRTEDHALLGSFLADDPLPGLTAWLSSLIVITVYCVLLTRRLLRTDLDDLSGALQ